MSKDNIIDGNLIVEPKNSFNLEEADIKVAGIYLELLTNIIT